MAASCREREACAPAQHAMHPHGGVARFALCHSFRCTFLQVQERKNERFYKGISVWTKLKDKVSLATAWFNNNTSKIVHDSYEGGNQTIGGGAGAPAGGVGSGGAPGQNASIPNRGSGGGGAGGSNVSGGTGSAGVIILRFPSTYTATVTGGVTSSTSTVGTDTVLTITATDNSSQTVTFA